MSEPYKVGNGLVVTLLEVKPYAEYEMKTFSLGEVSHYNVVSCQLPHTVNVHSFVDA